MHRAVLFSLACLAASSSVFAQSTPSIQASAGAGLLFLQKIDDGTSGSTWDFSLANQYRVSLEKSVSPSATLGITVSHAPLSLQYSRLGQSAGQSPSCTFECTATADYWSATASFRLTGGERLLQILEINGGVGMFRNFREDGTGIKLDPLDGDTDVTATFGYGGGWAPSPRFQVYLIGDVGFSLHRGSGLNGSIMDVAKLLSARLVIRSGF